MMLLMTVGAAGARAYCCRLYRRERERERGTKREARRERDGEIKGRKRMKGAGKVGDNERGHKGEIQ